ncbi:MAG: hypothetical protein ACWGOY_15965 [Anaerolineales bacterium]
MKLQQLFTINFPIAVFFGLTCALLPALVLQMYALPVDDAAVWVTRLVGGSILGFATLMWFGRKTANFESRRAIALALLIQDAVGFIASMEIQLRGNINAFGWTSPLLYGALAIGYAYFLFVRPGDS